MSIAAPTAAERAAHHVPLSIRIPRKSQPLIVGLLKSPLHGLLSKDVLLLTYRGRKSGEPYTLPLSYVEAGSHLYMCTRPEGSKWWLNLRGGVPVDLCIRGKARRATATVLDRDSPDAVDGLRAFVARYPGTGEMLYHVRRGPNEEDVQREVSSSIVVRLELA